MSKVKRVLGVIWASPITLVCSLFYALPFLAMGWYKSEGIIGDAWVLTTVENKLPGLLKKYWSKWAGHAMGNLVVLKKFDPSSRQSVTTLTHEMCHVHQCMLLGVFQPILYGACILAGNVLQKFMGEYDAYYDNPFEIHARRTAGQVIDVVGYVKKLKASKVKSD